MTYVALFFAGAFLCNCIPHLAAGLMGMPFPSPFAKPSGKGDSLPLVNFLWGAFNLIAGLVLLVRNPFGLGLNAENARARHWFSRAGNLHLPPLRSGPP